MASNETIAKVYNLFLQKGKGGFLTENSSSLAERKLFEFCVKNFEEMCDFFEKMGYELVDGGDYFYLNAKIKDKDLEEYLKPRIDALIKAINIFRFIYTCKKDLDVDYIVTSKELASAVTDDMTAKEQLGVIMAMRQGKTLIEDIEGKALNVLVKMGYMDKPDQYGGGYKVLSSYRHFQKMASSIENLKVKRKEEEDEEEW